MVPTSFQVPTAQLPKKFLVPRPNTSIAVFSLIIFLNLLARPTTWQLIVTIVGCPRILILILKIGVAHKVQTREKRAT